MGCEPGQEAPAAPLRSPDVSLGSLRLVPQSCLLASASFPLATQRGRLPPPYSLPPYPPSLPLPHSRRNYPPLSHLASLSPTDCPVPPTFAWLFSGRPHWNCSCRFLSMPASKHPRGPSPPELPPSERDELEAHSSEPVVLRAESRRCSHRASRICGPMDTPSADVSKEQRRCRCQGCEERPTKALAGS